MQTAVLIILKSGIFLNKSINCNFISIIKIKAKNTNFKLGTKSSVLYPNSAHDSTMSEPCSKSFKLPDDSIVTEFKSVTIAKT